MVKYGLSRTDLPNHVGFHSRLSSFVRGSNSTEPNFSTERSEMHVVLGGFLGEVQIGEMGGRVRSRLSVRRVGEGKSLIAASSLREKL